MFFRFADPASVGKSLLDGNKDYLHNQARSERTCETRTSSGISRQLYRRTSASSLCSKIGIGGRTTRKYWVSTRANKTTRRINCDGKSSSKNSDKKDPWDGTKRAQGITSWRILSAKIERRSWNNTEAHFTKTINARANKFWIIQVNFKKWNQITVDCFTFPVNQQCHLTHAIRLDNRKTFLVINFQQLTPEIITKEFIFFSTPGSTGPTRYYRIFSTSYRHRDPLPGHEDLNQRHNSNADICRKAVDHELSTVDIPQNSMVGQQRQQISKL